MADVSLLPIIGASTTSVATVILCASVGSYARFQGIIDDKGQKTLDQLVSGVLLPCLIFEKVTPNMGLAELRAVSPLILFCFVLVSFGLALGAVGATLLSKCVANPESVLRFKTLVMVACAFPNSFSVPLTLMLALGDHPAFANTEGEEALRSRENMLFLLSYAFWVLARWSIGYPILAGALTFSTWRAKVFNPPVVACLVAAPLGLMVNAVDLSIPGWLLTPVATAIGYGGRCSVPFILFVLGVRLYDVILEFATKPRSNADEGYSELGEGQPAMHPSVYALVAVLRLVGGPLLSMAVGLGLFRGLLGVEDRVVLMVGMLQGAGPPMINLGVMSGLAGSVERETSMTLLITYSLSIVSWTASISLFLAGLQV